MPWEGAKQVTHKLQASRSASHRGFSMLEMVIVIAMILILSGMAIISINGALPQEQVTAGMNAAEAVFRQGRDTAISERRNYQLIYTLGVAPAPDQVGLERIELGGTLTVLPPVPLPSPARFGLDPSITVDTPDGFGLCGNGLCFGGSPTQQWLSDGTFVNAVGQPLNATIFVHIPGNPSAQRAFTVLGTTGRIRAYKWTGNGWVLQ